MSIFKAGNVVVGGGSSSGGSVSAQAVQDWVTNAQYTDRDVVVFNGSQYLAVGSPGVGLIPPIEVNSPQIPGQAKWRLAARGRTAARAFDDQTTYYQDQVVAYLGGTYVLDAPTVPAGNAPNRDPRWTRLSEGLTETEAEKISTSDITNLNPNASIIVFANGDETARVRHHWIRATVTANLALGPLYSLRFPRAIRSQARPTVLTSPTDFGSSFAFLSPIPTVSGNQVTGYTMNASNGMTVGVWEFQVSVKEQIDQVR